MEKIYDSNGNVYCERVFTKDGKPQIRKQYLNPAIANDDYMKTFGWNFVYELQKPPVNLSPVKTATVLNPIQESVKALDQITDETLKLKLSIQKAETESGLNEVVKERKQPKKAQADKPKRTYNKKVKA
jgi:hypothetical protein